MSEFERPSIEIDPKKKLWDETAANVETITDKLGKRIDENIKEAVIGLGVFNINTTGSCEGHIDWGTLGPYIDVQSKEAQKLWQQAEVAERSGNKKEVSEIINEIERKNLEERRKLFKHLSGFYEDRQIPFHRRLIVKGLAKGWSRLESQGVGLQNIEAEEVKKERLQEYQDEMKSFAEYLKSKFFGD